MGHIFYFPSEGRHAEDFYQTGKIQRLRPGLKRALGRPKHGWEDNTKIGA
jgi:hypothetical protein